MQIKAKYNGYWLIYSDKFSAIRFRPLLWLNNETANQSHAIVTSENITSLAEIWQITDDYQPEQEVRVVLKQMADNLNHNSWQYLQDLTAITKHLPLATCDIWKIATSESKFLAALVIKPGFEDIVSRLIVELPVVWELVRINDWIAVLNNYKQNLTLSMASEVGVCTPDDAEMISKIIANKIEEIYKLTPSLDCLAKILYPINFKTLVFLSFENYQ